MIAEKHTDPFMDTADRLLEALAGLNVDPAADIPVEVQILAAARLGLTQQELREAHAELRRRMETDTAPAIPGGAKRLASRGARGIVTRIDQPKAARTLPMGNTTPAGPFANPADDASLRLRLEAALADRNGLTVTEGTALESLAASLGVTTGDVRAAMEAMRAEALDGQAPVTPRRRGRNLASGVSAQIDAPQLRLVVNEPVEPASGSGYPPDLFADQESFTARVYAVVIRESIDLRAVLSGTRAAMIGHEAGGDAVQVRAAFTRIRQRLGLFSRHGAGNAAARRSATERAITLDPPELPASAPVSAPRQRDDLPALTFQKPNSVIARVYRTFADRGIDPRRRLPSALLREVRQDLKIGSDSLKAALRRVREELDDAEPTTAPLAPAAFPVDATPPAGIRQASPQGVDNSARAAALLLVADLRTVDGAERSAALIQAGRLLERLL